MTSPLTTQRLVLRQPELSDADWIATDIALPEVHRWLTSPPCPYGRDDALDWIHAARAKPDHFVITKKDAPCGIISLGDELGFWLRPSAWGRGIAAEAAGAVLLSHFLVRGTPVRSGYILGNSASARVQDGLGFQPAQQEHRYSHFHAAPITIQVTYLSQADWYSRA